MVRSAGVRVPVGVEVRPPVRRGRVPEAVDVGWGAGVERQVAQAGSAPVVGAVERCRLEDDVRAARDPAPSAVPPLVRLVPELAEQPPPV